MEDAEDRARASSHRDAVKFISWPLPTPRKYRSTITTHMVQVQHLIKMAYGRFVAVLPGWQCFLHTLPCFQASR